jgi:DNA-binding beta-propeller fold protein YncE
MKSAPVLLLACVAALAGASDSGYKVLQKIHVPGNGSWDYLTVNPGAHRLYVSHATEVDVIDLSSGSIAGKIENTKGVHGIAVAPELGRGFTSNGAANTVTVFDLKTLNPLAEVPTGNGPDAIIYDPATKRVFAYNAHGESATVINAADATVAGTIKLEGAPEFSASDGKGDVFVNLEDKNQVLKIDARQMTVTARWPLAPCESPSSMAMDQKNARLFIGCRNHLMTVVNAGNGRVLTTMPIGDHVDAAAFDRDRRLIFQSCGDGTISVFHQDSPDAYTAVQTVNTQPGAKTMALDPATHRLYLSTAEYGPKPAETSGKAGSRAPVLPDSFTVLVVGN